MREKQGMEGTKEENNLLILFIACISSFPEVKYNYPLLTNSAMPYTVILCLL